MAKKPFFGPFCQKWPFWPLFRENSPVATGLKYAGNPKNGLFSQKGLKVPGPEPRRGVAFTSTPRGGVLSPKRGGFRGPPGGGGEMGSGARSESPRDPWGPGPGQPGDRAPARGVDVKPPSREGPVPDTGVRRTRWTSPGPGEPVPGLWPGSRDPGTWFGSPSRGPGRALGPGRPRVPPRPARRGLFYINPSRQGPVPVPGTSRSATSRRITPGRRGP